LIVVICLVLQREKARRSVGEGAKRLPAAI
jgi:hypothetical protein